MPLIVVGRDDARPVVRRRPLQIITHGRLAVNTATTRQCLTKTTHGYLWLIS